MSSLHPMARSSALAAWSFVNCSGKCRSVVELQRRLSAQNAGTLAGIMIYLDGSKDEIPE